MLAARVGSADVAAFYMAKLALDRVRMPFTISFSSVLAVARKPWAVISVLS